MPYGSVAHRAAGPAPATRVTAVAQRRAADRECEEATRRARQRECPTTPAAADPAPPVRRRPPPLPASTPAGSTRPRHDLLTRALDTVKGAQHGPGLETLVRRYYRHVAPEDLLGRDPVDVLGAVVSHRRSRREPPAGHRGRARLHPHASRTTAGRPATPSSRSSPTTCRSSSTRSPASARRAGPRHPPRDPPAVRRTPRRHRRAARGRRASTTRTASVPDGAHRRVVDARRDRPRDRPTRPGRRSRPRPAARAARRARGRRGLAADASARAARSPTSSRPTPPADRRRRRRSPSRSTCCAGSPTSTSPSSATASTTCSSADGDDRSMPCPAPGSASCARDRPDAQGDVAAARPRSRALAREPHAARAHQGQQPLHRAPRRLPRLRRRQDVRRRRATSSASAASSGCSPRPPTPQSRAHVPVLRRKVAAGARPVAASAPTSHSGKDLLADPRDLPARRAVPDRRRRAAAEIALAVLHLQERRQTRLFLRRDRYGRFVSCLVYLPRDRYTTDGPRCGWPTILREEFGGDQHRLHRPGVRVGAGPAALRRPRPTPAQHLPDASTPTPLEARLAEATRSWDDDFADALVDQCGEEQAARLLHGATPTPSPRPTRRTSPPRTAVADLRAARGARRADGDVALQPLRAARRRRRASAGFKIYRRGAADARSSDVLPVLQQHGRRGRRRAAVRDRPLGGRPTLDLRLRPAPRPPASVRARRALQERVPGRLRRGLARRGRGRRLQRARAARPGSPGGRSMVLRAYAQYLRQAGTAVQPALHRAVPRRQRAASPRLLVALFEARFDPRARRRPRAAAGAELRRRSSGALDAGRRASTRTASCARSSR